MMAICKRVNCNNKAVKIEWSGDKYCRECATKIDQAADGIKEQQNANVSMYGNIAGVIYNDEYWGRKPY